MTVLRESWRYTDGFLDRHRSDDVVFIRRTRENEFIGHVDVSIPELHLGSTAGFHLKRERLHIR